jgi:ketosteroid isomerase-like protein
MTQEDGNAFAADWISAWNRHDLPAILSHYDEDVVFLSPTAQRLVGNGRVSGMEALRTYWALGLASQPNLKFDLVDVLVGYQCLTILYRNHRGQRAAETFEFGAEHKVVRSAACYA